MTVQSPKIIRGRFPQRETVPFFAIGRQMRLILGIRGRGFLLCHEEIGEDIVAETSAKDEEVEDFMGAKVLMAGVEDREF